MDKKYNHFIEDFINADRRFNILDNYSFNKIKIHKSNMAQNRFINCYFKKTDFKDSSFTGSYFVDSSFVHCVFDNTIFDNCSFLNCQMDELALFKGASKERLYATSELANTLSLNASAFGKKDVALTLFLLSKEYRRQHEEEHINPTDDHYIKENKKRPEREELAKKWIKKDRVDRWFWNYGFGIINIFVSAFIFILLFTGAYLLFGDTLFESLTRSLVSFTTLGFLNIIDSSIGINFIMGIESFIGAIYIAITASMFYTKAKRTL